VLPGRSEPAWATEPRRAALSPGSELGVAAGAQPDVSPVPASHAGLTANSRADRLANTVSGGSAARRRSPVESSEAADEWPLRVLIVDDDALYPKLLFRLFQDQPWIEVVGLATNGRDAVIIAAATDPDVILMDLDMPLLDGIEATRLIKAQRDTTVLILTGSDNPGDREALLDAGAREVLTKLIDPQQLLARLHELHIDRSLAALGLERVPAWRSQRRQTQTESSPPRHGERSNQP
jgi:DNA-binding NarL/FixJ family response regulator